MKASPRKIELLAPARDALTAIAAIDCGADAVYIGAPSHGARAMAGNSVEDIERVVNYAHRFNARVYVTVNTLVYDAEISQVERLITDLHRVSVDAIIVQDMSILRMDIPPIALHASTQCDLRTPAKARFLADVGFSQLVMARELTLQEISAIHREVPEVALEAFVHGALCVSYSGRCQVSECLKGRSANRGACAQICRLPWTLEDGKGGVLMRDKHLLSLRDFNASSRLEAMMQAGVSSFKIEGRLKDEHYVKNVVAYYRQAIDKVIAAHPAQYCRASVGESRYTFTPDLNKSFNRSFTSYFLENRKPVGGTSMASINTPKSIGEKIGTVSFVKDKTMRLRTDKIVANGDGLSFFNASGEWVGVRVNRVDNGVLYLKDAVEIGLGTVVYRTGDKAFDDVLSRPCAERKIGVNMRLSYTGNHLKLILEDERGNTLTQSVEYSSLDDAKTNQSQRQSDVLGKLGDTIYRHENAEVIGEKFVPVSVLAQLRRDAVAALDELQEKAYCCELRRAERRDAPCFSTSLTYADNVANRLAESFSRSHGVADIQPALEVQRPEGAPPVMHTRYCLRRELGACLKEKNARKLPSPLYLCGNGTRLRVDCDCVNCEMKIFICE